MRSNFRVTSLSSNLDWIEDAYKYPDINDIIEQEERLREEKRARKRGKKSAKPMDAQNIKIRLALGLFVSKEEINICISIAAYLRLLNWTGFSAAAFPQQDLHNSQREALIMDIMRGIPPMLSR